MIITESRLPEKIIESAKPYAKIFVVGCAACATKCGTGDEAAVKKVSGELEKAGKKITGYLILDTPCDIRVVKRDLSKSEQVRGADAVLVLACGAGVQAAGGVLEKPLIPGLNPVFVGTTERIGVYHEFCALCGECILDKTAGICPVTRCAKGMVNGPCGGTVNGKCEIDPDKDCVWVLIIDRLKRSGKGQDIIKEYIPPRKYSKPWKVNRAKVIK